MRFSIVYDDNGTLLAASLGGDDAAKPVSRAGENIADFDIPDQLADAELHQAVERLLLDIVTINRSAQC
jgi:hypothetical protein